LSRADTEKDKVPGAYIGKMRAFGLLFFSLLFVRLTTVERKRSNKPVKSLKEVLLPFEVTFPFTVEVGVNRDHWTYAANNRIRINTYAEYEAIAHSSYAKYLGH
jgi:hypothetical protein